MGKVDEVRIRPECHADNGFLYPTDDKDRPITNFWAAACLDLFSQDCLSYGNWYIYCSLPQGWEHVSFDMGPGMEPHLSSLSSTVTEQEELIG